MTISTRDYWTQVLRMKYNVGHNPIETVPNAPLASAMGKELNPQLLRTLAIHKIKFKRYKYALSRTPYIQEWRLLA